MPAGVGFTSGPSGASDLLGNLGNLLLSEPLTPICKMAMRLPDFMREDVITPSPGMLGALSQLSQRDYICLWLLPQWTGISATGMVTGCVLGNRLR